MATAFLIVTQTRHCSQMSSSGLSGAPINRTQRASAGLAWGAAAWRCLTKRATFVLVARWVLGTRPRMTLLFAAARQRHDAGAPSGIWPRMVLRTATIPGGPSPRLTASTVSSSGLSRGPMMPRAHAPLGCNTAAALTPTLPRRQKPKRRSIRGVAAVIFGGSVS